MEEDRDIEVYRARLSLEPRPESEQIEGQHLPAREILEYLRGGRTSAPGPMRLARPNSGLSIRLV
jgi:hypothetical protein